MYLICSCSNKCIPSLPDKGKQKTLALEEKLKNMDQGDLLDFKFDGGMSNQVWMCCGTSFSMRYYIYIMVGNIYVCTVLGVVVLSLMGRCPIRSMYLLWFEFCILYYICVSVLVAVETVLPLLVVLVVVNN